MGLLDQLWDETVAGPPPDSGLGELRNRNYSSSAAADSVSVPAALTRSLNMFRPPSLSPPSPRAESSSVPSSPATAAPDSPFAPETVDGWRKLRRKSKIAGVGAPETAVEPRSPTVYDWVVISSLDR